MKNHLPCGVIFYGGKSAEHDISIITALQIWRMDTSLKRVYVDEQNKFWLVSGEVSAARHKKGRPGGAFTPVCLVSGDNRLFEIRRGKTLSPLFEIDCAYLCFHGLFGEDGCAQGLFELCGIAYTGCNVAASAVGMDKGIFKTFLHGLKVPGVHGAVFSREDYFEFKAQTGGKTADCCRLEKFVRRAKFPLIVKPARLGSSIGISAAKCKEELLAALETAFYFDGRVLVEKEIDNFYEVNCAALCDGTRVLLSPLEKPVASGEILSFADKYLQGAAGAGGQKGGFKNLGFGCAQEAEEGGANCAFEAQIKRDVEKICRALNVCGVVRVDCLVQDDKYYINEINTIPGSLAYHLFKKEFSPRGFLQFLRGAAKVRKSAEEQTTYAYFSEVLLNGRE